MMLWARLLVSWGFWSEGVKVDVMEWGDLF